MRFIYLGSNDLNALKCYVYLYDISIQNVIHRPFSNAFRPVEKRLPNEFFKKFRTCYARADANDFIINELMMKPLLSGL